MSDRVDVPKNYDKQLESREPANEDVQYGIAFAAVSKLVDASANSELLALRLSTCRNAFLTLNGIFVSLRPAFGHGLIPSPASRLWYELGRRNWNAALSAHSELSQIHEACRQKLDVWDRRAALDEEYLALLNTDGSELSRNERDLVRSILSDTATTSDDSPGQSWNVQYLSVSTDQPSWLEPYFITLRKAIDSLKALIGIGNAIAWFYEDQFAGQSILFGGSGTNAWAALTEQVEFWRDKVPMPIPDPDSSVSMVDRSQRVEFAQTLVEGLKAVENRVYRSLAEFKPNHGAAPLPTVFDIDLRRPTPERRHRPHCDPKQVTVGAVSPNETVRVAFPAFGIPAASYVERDIAFKEDQVEWINAAIERMVDEARAQNSDVVVFPEYFVPPRSIDRISKRATDIGIIFIGGIEGTRLTPRAKLDNVVRIRFPEEPNPYTQRKHYPSVLEPRDLITERTQHIFLGTRIGNFSVLICSDQLEQHIIDAIAFSDPPVDILFVCGFNPTHHHLARHIAITDSARLYCHVVLVNNASGTAEGSGVFSPDLDYDKQPSTGKIVQLGIRGPQGDLGMYVHDIPIRAPQSNQERERKVRKEDGCVWLPPPNFRRPFDPRGVT